MKANPQSFPPSNRTRVFITPLLALALAGTAMPSHALLGWLAKLGKVAETAGEAANVAGKAGKVAKTAEAAEAVKGAGAAHAAGKAAGVGAAAATTAEFAGASARSAMFSADELAHIAGKAPLAGASPAVIAATPPEVARYLLRPAQSLSSADSAQMLRTYQSMMAQASKTGDFTVLERMPSLHSAKNGVETAAASTTKGSTAINSTATAATASGLPSVDLSFHALRLLAHAANSNDNGPALLELQRYCKADAPQGQASEHAALCLNVPVNTAHNR